MQLAALLTSTIFASFFINLCLVQPSDEAACTVSWIRLMYMLSCGKRKRESVPFANETSVAEPVPTDIYDAIEYFRERDPNNPLFNEDIDLLNEILKEDERLFRREIFKHGKPHPKLMHWRRKAMEERDESIFLSRLFRMPEHGKHLEIRGFPDKWNVDEMIEMKTKRNYRRQVDRMLEQCCKTNQRNTCNEESFRGAC